MRYGKEGDAVRFATATNIVKKQLGIGEGFKSDAQRKAAFASGYKEKGKKKEEVEEGGPASGPQHKDITITRDGKTKTVKGAALSVWKKAGWVKEELDDKDKETIKPIIKQLQKSVKAHGKQAKQLQKDIKDEVEEGFKNDAERQAAVASLYSKLGLKGASKRSREKDKGKKKEEVELDEAISAAQVNQISRMTDRNNHFGARIELARIAGDKELMQHYASLEKMHNKLSSVIGNSALEVRRKLEAVLKSQLQRRFGDKDADRLMDAL
jgi:BMFP domain-containing protein YqiC